MQPDASLHRVMYHALSRTASVWRYRLNPKDYEKFVARLMRRLAKQDLVDGPSLKHLAKLEGKSGQIYEIDISYTFTVAAAKYLTLVECKHWNKPVGRNIVAAFSSVIDDIGAHKGIIVTTVGFQEGAIGLASKLGIALFKVSGERHATLHAFESIMGKSREYLEYLLEASAPYDGDGDLVEFVGLAFPRKHVIDFVFERYGEEVAAFLNDEDVKSLKQLEESPLRTRLVRAITAMDKDWIDDYLYLEACGIPYFIVPPEIDLRIMNLKIIGAKMDIQRADPAGT